jgi:hypothetical protein
MRQATYEAVKQEQHSQHIEEHQPVEAAWSSQPCDQEDKACHESATFLSVFLPDCYANQDTAPENKKAGEQPQRAPA